MTKIKVNGIGITVTSKEQAIENMFRRQWVNGNIKKYMQSVKRRVKEIHNIDLEFDNESEFFLELKKHNLIEIIEK